MTGTGWYNVETLGARDGAFDPNFTDAAGQPAGRPLRQHGVPFGGGAEPASAPGPRCPTCRCWSQGLQVPVYAADGTYVSDQFSSNPAWILLDILRRSGWAAAEIDLPSFAAAAAYCDQTIDVHRTSTATRSRFRDSSATWFCRTGAAAGDVVRGVRNAARLYLTYGPGGVLQLQVENTVALEQPVEAGLVEQHGGAERRLAELRIRRWQQRLLGNHAPGRTERPA